MSDNEYEKQILGKRQQNMDKLAELGLTPTLQDENIKKKSKERKKNKRTVKHHKKFTNPTAPERSSGRLNRSISESVQSRDKKKPPKEFVIVDPATICPPEQSVRYYHLELMKTFERLYPMLLSGEIEQLIGTQYAQMKARAAEIRGILAAEEDGDEEGDPESEEESNTRVITRSNQRSRGNSNRTSNNNQINENSRSNNNNTRSNNNNRTDNNKRNNRREKEEDVRMDEESGESSGDVEMREAEELNSEAERDEAEEDGAEQEDASDEQDGSTRARKSQVKVNKRPRTRSGQSFREVEESDSDHHESTASARKARRYTRAAKRSQSRAVVVSYKSSASDELKFGESEDDYEFVHPSSKENRGSASSAESSESDSDSGSGSDSDDGSENNSDSNSGSGSGSGDSNSGSHDSKSSDSNSSSSSSNDRNNRGDNSEKSGSAQS